MSLACMTSWLLAAACVHSISQNGKIARVVRTQNSSVIYWHAPADWALSFSVSSTRQKLSFKCPPPCECMVWPLGRNKNKSALLLGQTSTAGVGQPLFLRFRYASGLPVHRRRLHGAGAGRTGWLHPLAMNIIALIISWESVCRIMYIYKYFWI